MFHSQGFAPSGNQVIYRHPLVRVKRFHSNLNTLLCSSFGIADYMEGAFIERDVYDLFLLIDSAFDGTDHIVLHIDYVAFAIPVLAEVPAVRVMLTAVYYKVHWLSSFSLFSHFRIISSAIVTRLLASEFFHCQ